MIAGRSGRVWGRAPVNTCSAPDASPEEHPLTKRTKEHERVIFGRDRIVIGLRVPSRSEFGDYGEKFGRDRNDTAMKGVSVVSRTGNGRFGPKSCRDTLLIDEIAVSRQKRSPVKQSFRGTEDSP